MHNAHVSSRTRVSPGVNCKLEVYNFLEMASVLATLGATFLLALLASFHFQPSGATVIYSCFIEDVKTSTGTKPSRVTFPPSLSMDSKGVVLTLEESRHACPDGNFIVSRELPSMSKGMTVTVTRTMGPADAGASMLEFFTADGHVRVGNEYYAAEEYCIQRLERFLIELSVCNSQCSLGPTALALRRPSMFTLTPEISCIPKCCDLTFGINVESLSNGGPQCTKSAVGIANQGQNWIRSISGSGTGAEHVIILQNLTCPGSHVVPLSFRNWTSTEVAVGVVQGIRLKITRTGDARLLHSLKSLNFLNPVVLKFGDYCVDNLLESSESGSEQPGIALSSHLESESDTGLEQDVVLIVCNSTLQKAIEDADTRAMAESDGDGLLVPIVYAVLMTLSCTLLAITLLVHLLLCDKQKFHMWVVMSYVGSLLMLYIFLGVATIIRFFAEPDRGGEGEGETVHRFGCVFLGAATHLFLLSTFFWLTAINENLWTTFKSLNIPNSTSLLEEQRVGRFIWFSLVAWGIPVLIVGCGLVLDFIYENDSLNTPVILPNYGVSDERGEQCRLSSAAEGWYLFYPLGILLAFNVVFFSLTICRLMIYQRVVKATIGERSDSKWKLINIYLKLLLCALLIWLFEIVAWMLKLDLDKYYWIIIEAMNLIQSLLVFTMFTCRGALWKLLVQKYSSLDKFKPFGVNWDRMKSTINYGSNRAANTNTISHSRSR